MAKAAQTDDLKAAFQKHERETQGQVKRLEQVFSIIGEKLQGKTCDAILGIIEEGQEVMKEYKGSPALDPSLLAAAQAVEHYEISRYGTLRTWAQELGHRDAVKLLETDAAGRKEHRRDVASLPRHASIRKRNPRLPNAPSQQSMSTARVSPDGCPGLFFVMW